MLLFLNYFVNLQDVVSYRAVGVPPERIMIIDKTGRVHRADEIGYESSYMSIAMDTVDYIFPPLQRRRKTGISAIDSVSSAAPRVKNSFPKPQTCRSFFFSLIKVLNFIIITLSPFLVRSRSGERILLQVSKLLTLTVMKRNV